MRWGILFLFVYAFTCGATEKYYLTEDFENGTETDFFKTVWFHKKVSQNTNKAIQGEKSLKISSYGNVKGWNTLLILPEKGVSKLGRFYKLTFSYKTLNLEEESCIAVTFEGLRNNKRVLFGEKTFSTKKSDKGRVEIVARAENGTDKCRFKIVAKNKAELIIDDILCESIEPTKDARWIFEPNIFKGMKSLPTDSAFLDLSLECFGFSKEKFFPFIDKYGQFKHRNWKGKIKDDSDFAQRIAEEETFLLKNPPLKNRDEFLGLINPNYKYTATGRFRVEKINNKWFFITPKGNLFWSFGINAIGNFPTTPITNREYYFDDISSKKWTREGKFGKGDYGGKHSTFLFCLKNLELKYGIGILKRYGEIADRRMLSWGINTKGAWSALTNKEKIPYVVLPYIPNLTKLESKYNLYAFWAPCADYFADDFPKKATTEILKYKGKMLSPYCIGAFVDNELPWQDRTGETARGVLSCPENQPAKKAFLNMLRFKYKTIQNLNNTWDASYPDWNGFLKEQNFQPLSDKALPDFIVFEREYYKRYFSVCRNAIKKISPDILYLGCRFAWHNDNLINIASKYCDVISFNLYREEISKFRLPQGSQDKPVIAGEFQFGNLDRGVFGGGLGPCDTLKDRVISFRRYINSALFNPIIIGAHWFQWFDQPATGVSNGENFSVGFLDICDTPCYEMIIQSRRISENMYKTRLD